MRIFPSLFLAFLLQFSLIAQAETPFGGAWFGAIEVPNQELEIEIEFSSDDDGTLSGTISIPAQSLFDAPLEGIERDGDSIRFAIPDIPGDPAFEGALAGDTSIEGTFSQGGAEFAFELNRENPADAARFVFLRRAEKARYGHWPKLCRVPRKNAVLTGFG